MRLLIVSCVLAFGLPGLTLAQEQTTKPSRGGHGGSLIKRDSGANSQHSPGAAIKGGSQQNSSAGGQQPPATPPKQ
jgi:uncharacterized membrane protein